MFSYLMYVKRYRDLFLETKNPIYAWRSFENARRMKYPVPEEILDYILKTAHEIVRLAQDPPGAAQRPIALAKALKLHKSGAGQGSAFSEYSTRLKNRKLAIDVIANEYYDPDYLDAAFTDIEEKKGISKSTVRRNFLKHKDKWRAMAKRLIDAGAVKYEPDGIPKITNFGTADDMREASEILKEIEYIQASA